MARLPERLTISFWLWNYFYGIQEGGAFHDLEKRFTELRERGFNCVRVDSGVGLIHSPDGKRRGRILLRSPFGEFSNLRQLNVGKGNVQCDVLERVLELFRQAERHDVHVVLSSWFYLHTFWYVDDRIRREMWSIPPRERFMYFARDYDRLIARLKDEGLHTRIAYVDIFNEFSGFGTQWHLMKATASAEERRAVYCELRRWHEEALAFLRDRHPDLLWAMDTASPGGLDALPRNAQVWDQHMYYCWSVYKLLDDYVQQEEFDFAHASKHPVIGRFLRESAADIAAVRRSANDDPHIEEGWYRRVWLYNSLKAEALPEIERLLSESLIRDMAEYRRYAEENVAAGLSIRNEHFPGMPLVVSECATYCAHPAMRWEERSDAYWSLIEYMVGLLKQAGYWGCTPRTHSGPEDPSWTECPDRLRHANELFLKHE
ncbi:MAG: cellulase-like family protein [Kiritimatiellae bacterium]|nr:cellulase-like family protein [Kiritimatiellia bacterium]